VTQRTGGAQATPGPDGPEGPRRPAHPVCGLVVALGCCVAGSIPLAVLAARGDGRLSVDTSIVRYAVEEWPSRLRSISAGVTLIGSFGVTLVLALMAAALLVRPAGWRLATAPLVSLLLAALASHEAKAWLGRPRPPAWMHHAASSGYSFPSGHSTHAASFLVALALVVCRLPWDRRVRIGTAIAAAGGVVLVGASRVVLGVHWPTDVLGGWLLGAGVACGTVVLAQLGPQRDGTVVSPPAPPTG